MKRHIETWEAKRKGEIVAVDLPDDIAARGRDFVQALYAHALHGAKAAVAEPLALAEAAREKSGPQPRPSRACRASWRRCNAPFKA